MADAPIMPLDTGAFISDTLHLTAAETGAYLMLLFVLWRSGGSLDQEPRDLARYARVSANQWPRVWKRLESFFIVKDGIITQKKATKTLSKVLEKIETNRVNASKGGRAKSLKTKDPALANGSQTQDPAATDALKENSSREAPIKTKTKTKELTPKSPNKGTCWIPVDLSPEYEEAAEIVSSIDSGHFWDRAKILGVYEVFSDYWVGVPGYRGRKADWLATWRNWVRREINDRENKPGTSKDPKSAAMFWSARFASWFEKGFWSDDWGPSPDVPGFKNFQGRDVAKLFETMEKERAA